MIVVSVGTMKMCCSDLKDSLHEHDRLIALVANPWDPPLSVVFILAISVECEVVCHYGFDLHIFGQLMMSIFSYY